MNDVGPFLIKNPTDPFSRPDIPRFTHMPPQPGRFYPASCRHRKANSGYPSASDRPGHHSDSPRSHETPDEDLTTATWSPERANASASRRTDLSAPPTAIGGYSVLIIQIRIYTPPLNKEITRRSPRACILQCHYIPTNGTLVAGSLPRPARPTLPIQLGSKVQVIR